MDYMIAHNIILSTTTAVITSNSTHYGNGLLFLFSVASEVFMRFLKFRKFYVSLAKYLSKYLCSSNLLIGIVQLAPLGTAVTNRPIVPAPGNYDDGEIDGMIGRGNRSIRRNPAAVPLCPPQTPHAARKRTRPTAVGGQLLTA
jgi:hypothetical protein